LRLPVSWGDYGHTSRNIGMTVARNEYCLHMDDDDIFCDGAFTTIRQRIMRTRKPVYIFKMIDGEGHWTRWGVESIYYGNVGTPMIVHRRVGAGTFKPYHGGDQEFMSETVQLLGNPEWCPEVIAVIRPLPDRSYAPCPTGVLLASSTSSMSAVLRPS
jgi:hypothetical protein